MQEILQKLDLLSVREAEAKNTLGYLESSFEETKSKEVSLAKAKETVLKAQSYYKEAVDIYYEESVGFLMKLLNAALKEVIPDKDYSLDIVLDDKRGKSLKFALKNGDEEVNLKDGVGMGIRTVISAILHIYCLIEQGANYLFIDEKYSYLSEGYVEQFFDFIKKFCKQFDFHLIMISHDPRFFNYVDKVYQVNDGIVKEVKA